MMMRAIGRKCILDCLGMFSYPANGIHILNGHMINKGIPIQGSEYYFRSQLEQLSRYVRFIRIEEAVSLIVKREPVDAPLVAFTFDDGFMECYNMIAPVLEEFGVNAAFFINPNFVEGDENYIRNFTENIVLTPGKSPMRWKEIKELHDRGHIIGAHTMDHYMINDNNLQELNRQIGDCKSVIEKKLSVTCDYFAFPYGRLEHASKDSIDIACDYYKYVFSQSDYKHYFSFNGRVINRRHFEPFWPVSHLYYFLSCHKKQLSEG